MIAPARQAALRVLDQVERGATLADALARERDGLPDSRDRALVTEIATGTLRWLARLDAVLAAHSSRPLDTLDPVVRRILRLAAYQLLFLDRIPARAVVDDAVEQTRAGGHQKATGFANGLLRSLIRGQSHARTARNAVATRPGADLDLDALAAELSHPRWLLARWVERYGLDAAVRWTRFNNEPAALTLRTNTSRGSREALLAALADEAIVSEPTTVAAQGLRVRSGDALSSQAMRDGRFIVQDEASQLVGELAAALAGPRMLDACAAPGGKTLALATALLGAPVLVVAADRRPRRLRLLRQNLVRAGIRPTVLQIDLRRALPFPPIFDLVLVDAPCSGLGTLRREPDIKWRRAEAELPELARAQGTMLDVASRVVAPGGRLVYATCSSEPEENDEVVDAFLGRHPEFEAIRAPTDRVAPGLASVLDGAGRLRTLPHEHGLEAFFASSLVRKRGRESFLMMAADSEKRLPDPFFEYSQWFDMALTTRVWSLGKLLVLAGALAGTFVLFFAIAVRVALRSRDVVVPRLAGAAVNDASAALTDLGLTLRVEDLRRLDAKVPEGRIVAQEPAPGSTTRRPRSVKVWLSAGARAPVVPMLVGASERSAQLRLQADGLRLVRTVDLRSSDYPVDTVVAQYPAGNIKSADVVLLVNRGEPGATYVMPDVIGVDGARAAEVLRNHGFRVAVVGSYPYPGIQPGIVLRQNPRSGFRVAPGDAISLEVSR